MKTFNKRYKPLRFLTALLMMLTLAWLTVSLPFVNEARQKAAAIALHEAGKNTDSNSTDPFGNTTEEKNPNTNNTLAEEFLHEQDEHTESYPFSIQYNKCTSIAVYVAFHGELLSPPPEA
jgi:hypothetical protein